MPYQVEGLTNRDAITITDLHPSGVHESRRIATHVCSACYLIQHSRDDAAMHDTWITLI
jgi:hypothetical protein